MGDRAKGAISGANITQNHKGTGFIGKTLANIWALG
jgi:hypothetical protein